MKLQRIVKVGNITNLSDARYCAGMGVHMLGFNAIESQPGHIPSETFQEFRGWFAGPSIVVEAYGLPDAPSLHTIMQNYLPDFIEVSVNELPLITIPSVALIVSSGGLPVNQLLDRIAPVHTQVAWVQAEDKMPAAYVNELAGHYPVLLRLNGPLTTDYLNYPVKGFAMAGGTEEKPGLKSYDHLAAVLEQLADD
jgi:phosphoribosylanthranilate isomerase